MVTVPRGYSVFAGPAVIKPIISPRNPEFEICVVSFDPQTGRNGRKEKRATRIAAELFGKELWVMLSDHRRPDHVAQVDFDRTR